MKTRISLTYILPVLFVMAGLTLACTTSSHPTHYLEAEVKTNLHAIQIAIEHFAADNEGLYPATIDDLGQGDYMPEFPTNPVTDEPMKEIEFGSEPFSCEYTYIPYSEEDVVIGYYLVCYGLEDTDGDDLDADGTPDHVILVLEGYNAELGELPPIEELL